MKKNINSSRTDYVAFCKNYENTNQSEEPNVYLCALGKRIDKRSLVVISGKGNDCKNTAQAIVKALKNSKTKVYLDDKYKNSLSKLNCSNVFFYEKNSDEYFEILARSKYIFSDTVLYYSLVKRNKQVLCVDLKGFNDKTAQSRIHLARAKHKADMIIDSKNKAELTKFTDLVSRKKSVTEKSVGKKKLLFAVDLLSNNYEFIFSYFNYALEKIDFNQYDVSLFLNNSGISMYENYIDRIDKKVNIFVKKGKMFADSEEKKRVAFLNQELFFIDDAKKIRKFAPDTVFDYEIKRCLGNKKFDAVINVGFNKFYWLGIFEKLGCKKIFVDLNTYPASTANINYFENRFRWFNNYNQFYFKNSSLQEDCNALTDRADKSKQKILDYSFDEKAINKTEPEYVSVNGERKLLTERYTLNNFDSMRIKTMPIPSEDDLYTVIENTMPREDAEHFLKELAKREEMFYVFDFFGVVPFKSVPNDKNVFYTTSMQAFASAQDFLKNEIKPNK